VDIEAIEKDQSTAAIERLFRDAGPGLWRALCAYSGGRVSIAEEAMAEAFARALQHAHTLRNPLAWIYRTAFRLAAAELRRERRRPPEIEPPDPPGFERLTELMDALRRLSPSQRAAVVLHYHLDLPVSEVAARLGMAPATVKVHLHRGRRRLRALLEREEELDA
jgi:RNA polymerase sigma-70 factor, ECF subfamily